MRYFKKLVGEHIYLSPMNVEDVEIYTKWMNDGAVAKYLGMFRKMVSLHSEQKVLEEMATEGYNFAIVLKEEDVLIGNISLMHVDNIHGKATIGLFIGDLEQRGKGYGTEALRLIVHYGFRTLNLHNIMLEVYADNVQGIACYQKAGFQEFGRRHESCYKDGRYVDTVYMELLRSTFEE